MDWIVLNKITKGANLAPVEFVPESGLACKEVLLSLVLLLISNLTNELRLNQFLLTKSAVANKSLKTDANGAH